MEAALGLGFKKLRENTVAMLRKTPIRGFCQQKQDRMDKAPKKITYIARNAPPTRGPDEIWNT